MFLDKNIVSTAVEYFDKVGGKIDWDETGNKDLVSMKQFNLVGEIISAQVSFWCLRRLSNSCESNCDYMKNIINSKINEYESQYGDFNNFNKENIW